MTSRARGGAGENSGKSLYACRNEKKKHSRLCRGPNQFGKIIALSPRLESREKKKEEGVKKREIERGQSSELGEIKLRVEEGGTPRARSGDQTHITRLKKTPRKRRPE